MADNGFVPQSRLILRHLLGLNVASILRNLFGLLRAKVAAIMLGVAGVGILGQILTVFSVQNRLSSLGIDALLINRIGKLNPDIEEPEYRNLVFNSLFLLIIINLGLFLILMVFVNTLTVLIFDDHVYYILMFLLIILGPIYSLSYFFEIITQARTDFKHLITGRNYSSILSIIFCIPLIYFFKEVGIVLGLYVYVLSGGLYFLIINRDILSTFSFRYIRDIKYLIPVFFKIGITDLSRKFAVVFSLMIFRIIIVKNLGMTQNGLFQALWSISYYPEIFIGALVSYFFPIISKAKTVDLKIVLSTNFEFLIFLMFPLIALIMLFPDFLLILLFNKEFLVVKDFLQILIFLKFLESIYIYYNLAFLAQSQLKAFIVTEAIRSITLVIVSFYLIPTLNLTGAILSVVIMQVVSFILMIYYILKNPAYYPNRKVFKEFMIFFVLLIMLFIPLEWNIFMRVIKLAIFCFLCYKFIDLKKYQSAFKMVFEK